MNIIKLSATSSTNDYLKQLSKENYLPNFTVVSTEIQTNGRGQMGASWQSEKGKSLLFSFLVKNEVADISAIFLLNVLAALAVVNTLGAYKIAGLSIKWPNDILSYNKKIGGILIENVFKSSREVHSIIGIGLNMYPSDFTNLPQASSVFCSHQMEIDRDEVMLEIIEFVKQNFTCSTKNIDFWWNKYHEKLYQKDVPNLFEKEGKAFTGIIRGVTRDGFLVLEDESGEVQTYGLKEIKMIY